MAVLHIFAARNRRQCPFCTFAPWTEFCNQQLKVSHPIFFIYVWVYQGIEDVPSGILHFKVHQNDESFFSGENAFLQIFWGSKQDTVLFSKIGNIVYTASHYSERLGYRVVTIHTES